MAAIAVNSLMQAIGNNQPYTPVTKTPIIDRTHFSGPSSGGGGYHTSGHSHGSGKHIALTALTLLAFLFFLNILQNCIDDHMESLTMTPQNVIIMSAARIKAAKEAQKRKGDDQSVFINSSLKVKKEPKNTWKKIDEIYDNNNNNVKPVINLNRNNYEFKKP